MLAFFSLSRDDDCSVNLFLLEFCATGGDDDDNDERNNEEDFCVPKLDGE